METTGQVYDREYDRGSSDGYAGNQPAPPPTEPGRIAYLEGYRDGVAAYRRTLEGAWKR